MSTGNFSAYLRVILAPLLIPLFASGLAGCENTSQTPAPVGDHGALEQLATAYRGVAQEYPVQPASMRPAGKKEFLERVFVRAGYHYAATLKAMARQGMNITNQDQRDLVELLFLSHRGLADADMALLYSDDELAAIRTIQAALK